MFTEFFHQEFPKTVFFKNNQFLFFNKGLTDARNFGWMQV